MNDFKEIGIKDLKFNPFRLKDKWMLVTAGDGEKANAMTASWGGFGVMWNKDVTFVVIRPQRYTKQFMDSTDSFSLTFFDKEYKKDLTYLGTVSGRDEDKMSKIGLNVVWEKGVPYFKEAHSVIFVKKLFAQPIKEEFFIEQELTNKWYPEKDYHTLYISEVTQVLVKDNPPDNIIL